MNIVIKNGHIVDPSQKIDGIGDVVIEDGKIIEVISQKSKASRKIPPHPPLQKGGKGGLKILTSEPLMQKDLLSSRDLSTCMRI